MRTVKRKTLAPNTKKRKALDDLREAYTREKRFWVQRFQAWNLQSHLGRPRTVRDEAVKQGYRSSHGLQARHWKLALEDAAEIGDKYWQATFVKVRLKISHRKDFSEVERHYAYWLLKNYPAFVQIMQGKCPEPSFPIESPSRRRVSNCVRRFVRQCRGKVPTIKKSRTIRFDANCYEVFEHKGRQYIKLMSLIPGKRISLPLSGKTAISGTITLVLSTESIELHIPQELKKKSLPKTPMEAVDFGLTEVMTDTQGIRYGIKFGKTLVQGIENRDQKMRKRHKLYAIRNKKNVKQAKRLRKYNLGKKKLRSTTKRLKVTLEKEINTAVNQLIKVKNPSLLVTEDLRHTFTYNRSKSMNRKFSGWIRGKLQDRIAFKALAEGFRHEQVNAAYGSQSCPCCEFVDQGNRIGDRFQCLYCKHEDMADRVAAQNYARRFDDPEIGLYTPYGQVKIILLDRFNRRLETGQPVTVPGKTLETVEEMCSPSLSRPCHSREGEISQTGRSIRERNRK